MPLSQPPQQQPAATVLSASTQPIAATTAIKPTIATTTTATPISATVATPTPAPAATVAAMSSPLTINGHPGAVVKPTSSGVAVSPTSGAVLAGAATPAPRLKNAPLRGSGSGNNIAGAAAAASAAGSHSRSTSRTFDLAMNPLTVSGGAAPTSTTQASNLARRPSLLKTGALQHHRRTDSNSSLSRTQPGGGASPREWDTSPRSPAPPAAARPVASREYKPRDRAAPTSRTVLAARMLACYNCESCDEQLVAWCNECQQAADEEDTGGVVSKPTSRGGGPADAAAVPAPACVLLCAACDAALHKPSKMQKHKRTPVQLAVTAPQTAVELHSTDGLPAGHTTLSALLCNNCESETVDVTSFCGACQCMLLCLECVRALHSSKAKRMHKRAPCHAWFVSNKAIAPDVALAQQVKRRSLAAANSASSAAASAAASNKTTSAAIAKSPTSAAATSGNATSPSAMLTKKKSFFKEHGNSMTAERKSLENNANNNAKSSVTAATTTAVDSSNTTASNATVPGDVLLIREPTVELSDAPPIQALQCRNTYNDWDTLGSVQIRFVACGKSHGAAISAGGSLFTFGRQDAESCVLGFECAPNDECLEPNIVQLPGGRPAQAVACGHEHTLVLAQDGTLYSWGTGLMGKLGHGSDVSQASPKLVTLAHETDVGQKVTHLACGQFNSGVLVTGRRDKKQMYVWGQGSEGQLGLNNRQPQLLPTLGCVKAQDGSLPPLVSLSFGNSHASAVTATHHAYTWGNGNFGQLGYKLTESDDATTSTSAATGSGKGSIDSASDRLQLVPRLVMALQAHNVKPIQASCGELHTSWLGADGSVWSCGSGDSHLLGIMDNVDQFTPVKAAVLASNASPELKAISLSVGLSGSAAVTESGDTYLWGYSVEKPIPTLCAPLQSSLLQQVAIGAHDMMCALTGQGDSVYEWHFNEADASGAAGTQDDDAQAETAAENEASAHDVTEEPVLNRSLRGKRIAAIAVGKTHIALVTKGGTLMVQGSSVDDQLGTAVDENLDDVAADAQALRLVSVAIPDSLALIDVKCSAEHSLALSRCGKVLAWGRNSNIGRLGNGSGRDSVCPQVCSGSINKHKIVYICIGPLNSGAITESGLAYVWGSGNSGVLGNRDSQPVLEPQPLAALQHQPLAGLAFGNRHAAFVTRDGAVYTCGSNEYGQCGQGAAGGQQSDSSKFMTPTLVQSLSHLKCVSVACGDNVTLVVTADGQLWGCGTSETRQLCNDSEEDEYAFRQIAMPPECQGVVSLCVTAINCAALCRDGSVVTFGWNLGERPTVVQMVKREGLQVQKIAMGESCLMLIS